MAFRGIGDTATEVAMKQDQLAVQASQAAAARAQQDSQFKASMEAQKENTAWNRSNTEAVKAEEARRFDIGQQKVERQLSMQEFSNTLMQQRNAAEATKDAAQTKVANLQFAQYDAAAKEEALARSTREAAAKSAFGSLVIVGRQHGGVMPQKAIELANQQLADKDTFIQGGGFDEETGIAWFDVVENATGKDPNKSSSTVKTIRLTPENQYTMIHGGLGKEAADGWKETFKVGSSARAGIELRQREAQDKEAAEIAKEQRKLDAERSDPTKIEERALKKAELFQKFATDFDKLASVENPDATPDERKSYRQDAAKYRKMADSLLMPQAAQPKQLVITPEALKQAGVPNYAKPKPNQDGTMSYVWQVGKDVYEEKFGQNGKPVDMGGAQATSGQSAKSTPAVVPAKPATQSPTKATQSATTTPLPSDDELKKQRIYVDRDKDGNPVAARRINALGNPVKIPLEQVSEMYNSLAEKDKEEENARTKRQAEKQAQKDYFRRNPQL